MQDLKSIQMKALTRKLRQKWWTLRLAQARMKYGNPSEKLKIVGATGTNGKTTTATLLYKTAMALGYKTGLIGTVEILIAGEKFEITSTASLPGTTPDSVTLTKIFARMVKAGCEYVFMEVSSHAMDQRRVAGVHFVGGIFTNLTQDHLDYHKTMQNYFRAKQKFFQMLPRDAFALANGDDEHGAAMIADSAARKFFYSFDTNAEFRGKIKRLDFNGLELDFNGEKITSKLLGKFNAYNLLAVWSACSLLGFDMKQVNKILENIKPPKGRFDYFISKTDIIVVVDYAHTPDALEKIVSAVKEVKPNEAKLITVFGCGGDRDPLKRRIMGKIGAAQSDLAIFTSDNPRGEDPEKIIAEMKTDLSLKDSEKVRTIANRREAIAESVKLAQKGDIILCAGKGHETYQEIKGVKNHFDDMEEYKKLYE